MPSSPTRPSRDREHPPPDREHPPPSRECSTSDRQCSTPDREHTAGRARVILVTGPSGSGKSRLSRRLSAAHGWPVVQLDDFYREADDPDLPRSPLGIPDWDHADSWNAPSAINALRTLVDTGSVDLPRYDISKSAVVGHHLVTAGPGTLILAEGLFAPRLVQPLAAEGLLADAICVRRNRWHTFVLRLARDLSERRKPPHILVRRGIALLRDDRRVIDEATGLGARPVAPKRAERELLESSSLLRRR